MATSNLTALEKKECKAFLQTLLDPSSCKKTSTGDDSEESFSHDNHFESLCFCMTDDEIPGELIDIANRYLHLKYDSYTFSLFFFFVAIDCIFNVWLHLSSKTKLMVV